MFLLKHLVPLIKESKVQVDRNRGFGKLRELADDKGALGRVSIESKCLERVQDGPTAHPVCSPQPVNKISMVNKALGDSVAEIQVLGVNQKFVDGNVGIGG